MATLLRASPSEMPAASSAPDGGRSKAFMFPSGSDMLIIDFAFISWGRLAGRDSRRLWMRPGRPGRRARSHGKRFFERILLFKEKEPVGQEKNADQLPAALRNH
jgi:hypothetical protein